MKKLRIIVLLLLTQCSCEKEEQMIINPYVYHIGGDTTDDDRQVTVVIGDSNADGRGSSVPVVGADTLYHYTGGSIVEVTTQSVDNSTIGDYGSAWQQYATEKKSLTGFKTVLVNAAKGGAEFYPNGDNDNWYTSGTLYDAMKMDVDACLALLGLSLPKTIIIVLGVNDIRSANSVANISTGITSLFDRLETDFPGVSILVTMPGRNEATDAANTEKSYDVRRLLQTEAFDRDNVHIVGCLHTFTGTGMVQVDNLHFTQAGYDAMGNWYARWEANTGYSKWGRSIMSAMFDDMSSTRKTLIDDFISAQVTNGNFQKLESLAVMRTTEVNNVAIDWVSLGYNLSNTVTFNANANVATSGISPSSITANYTPSLFNEQAGASDVVCGVRVGTVTTASGTSAGLMGGSDGTTQMRISQSTTLINGSANSATNINGTDSNIQSNNLYAVARNGTSEVLYKNKVQHATRTLAGTGVGHTQAIIMGSLNISGSVSFHMAVQLVYFFAAKYSDFDYDSFVDDIEYMIAHWND